MVVSHSKNRLHTIGLLSLLTLCMVPSHVSAGSEKPITTKQKILIIATTATGFLLCSENARTLIAKGTLKSVLASLHLLLSLPLSDAMKQVIQAKIEYLETMYTTRGNIELTGEVLKAMIKEFKEMIDGAKAIETVATWAHLFT
jgi:hypothetical protein